MSLLFIDGFDHYATADINKKWSASNSAAIVNGSGRRGSGALQISATSGSATKNLPAAKTALVVGFAINHSTAAQFTLVALYETGISGSHVSVIALSDGSIRVQRNDSNPVTLGTSAPGVFAFAAWQYVEVKAIWGDTTGAVEVRVNGTTVLTLTNVDTNNGGTTGFTQIGLPSSIAASGTRLYDDFYVLDTNGTTNNDFRGDCRVDAYYPTSEGTTQQWTPTPAGTHYTTVDEAAPSATDYVESSTAGAVELFGFNDLVNVPAQIFGVQANSCVLKNDAGARQINNATRIGTTNYFSGNLSVSDSALYSSSLWDVSPATGTAWTRAEINAAEFGVRLV